MKIMTSETYGKLTQVNVTVKCSYCRGNSSFQCVFIGDIEYNKEKDERSGKGIIKSGNVICSKCGKSYNPVEVLKYAFRKTQKETQHKV
jgi:hypothetical protein